MTEYLQGGRRRMDRVLAPPFRAGLTDLALGEVRARRTDADQEEADLSFARRLLQGRIDILRAERAAREGVGPLRGTHHTDAEIVEALTQVLGAERREDHGLGRHLEAAPSRVGANRREAERAVADVGGSDLAAMSDHDLATAIERLSEIEGRVSRTRREVQSVVDCLTEEIARRYMTGEVTVTSSAVPEV